MVATLGGTMPKVLITGGSRGIGAATAKVLTTRGWEVVAPARADLDLQREASVGHYITSALPKDLTGLILNAHGWYSVPLTDQYLADFDVQMAYVRHHWALMREVLRQGTVQSVVAVGSTRGLIGGVNSAPYSMAKAALICLMQGFAREYNKGVRFSCICPGLTATDMESIVRATGGASLGAMAQHPLDVATLIADALEDEMANGIIWRINGGKTDQMQWCAL